MFDFIKDFLKLESASGIVLLLVSLLALLLVNSPLSEAYGAFVTPLTFTINDGLMALFFLLVGLEIKREIKEGELSTRANAMLPLFAALGGVILPALIYLAFNAGTPEARGWAIPSATDIAFSLGVLALFGDRIPHALKIFLMSVAVIDDLVAVIIIALFYTDHISALGLVIMLGCIVILWGLNRCVTKLWPYLIVGIVLWGATLHSGIHPTIAGVILGLMIPLSLAKPLIHRLHPYSAFGVMPIFAFANAGVPLTGLTTEQLSHPVSLGIILGLFFGKQIGIFAASWLVLKLSRASLPAKNWLEFYAVCLIAGIGFTMSLFIGTLAFTDAASQLSVRLGVIIGSLLSAIFGYSMLTISLRKQRVA